MDGGVVVGIFIMDATNLMNENADTENALQRKMGPSHIQVHEHYNSPNEEENVKVDIPEKKIQDVFNYFSCKVCPYTSKYLSVIDTHFRRHRVTKNSKIFNCYNKLETYYKCKYCRYRTSYLVNYQKHTKTTHKCDVEVKVETDFDSALNFGKAVNFLKTYYCKYCPFKTQSQLLYLRHYFFCVQIISDEEENNYEIELVGLYGDKGHLQSKETHNSNTIKNNHVIKKKKIIKGNRWSRRKWEPAQREYLPRISSRHSSVTWYQCDLGDFKTKHCESLEEHILTKHVSSKTVTCYKCELCSTFRTFEEEEMNNHVLERHVDPQYNNWFECQMCPEKFKKDAELKAHVMVKHIL